MQPAPVLELRLVGAGLLAFAAIDLDALANDGIRHRCNHRLVGRARSNGGIGKAVKLLILAVAHHQAVLIVPQDKGFRDRLDGVAEPRIGVRRCGTLLLLCGGDRGAERLGAPLLAAAVVPAAPTPPLTIAAPPPPPFIRLTPPP